MGGSRGRVQGGRGGVRGGVTGRKEEGMAGIDSKLKEKRREREERRG